MQKCYNCGLEVDDNVLICPECGALVKRYGRPEPQTAQQPQTDAFTFDNAPQPQGAVLPPYSNLDVTEPAVL